MGLTQMPYQKWLRQYVVAFPVLVAIFTLSQYLKGYALGYAVEFAVFWAAITIAIFAIIRMYNAYRDQYCVLCNDVPDRQADDQP